MRAAIALMILDFFAFADPSLRDRVEGGKERPGESAKFAGFDFICSRLPLKAVHRQLAGKPRLFRGRRFNVVPADW
ncbi:hypothetical protein ATY75_23105 [Rhizobium sp. N122]|uniref:hypothetical protein n=1 Tax=Rhizobium sp. N122 TaxID=1764272 RepID=UPI000B5A9D05|nr:hypothetical protein [Rhizobium sp. N122]OWV86142.1 hypothetical protein ATY75_23105 [Rhizobium sp. N122]